MVGRSTTSLSSSEYGAFASPEREFCNVEPTCAIPQYFCYGLTSPCAIFLKSSLDSK